VKLQNIIKMPVSIKKIIAEINAELPHKLLEIMSPQLYTDITSR
jgi:hypothetical protein